MFLLHMYAFCIGFVVDIVNTELIDLSFNLKIYLS